MSAIKTCDIIRMMINNTELTQRDIAKKANVSEVSLSRYINGEREPTFVVFQNIAIACDYKISIHQN